MFAALTLLLTTGSVFFLCLVMFGIFTKAMEQYQERYVTKSMTDMSDMFLFIDARQVMILNICTFFMFAIVGWLAFNPVMCFLLAGLGFFAPMAAVKFYRRRRIKKFNVQLVDALQAMANAFKAGLTFPQAIEHISKESAPPLQQEFSLFVKEIKLGVPLEEALINMGKRVGSEAATWPRCSRQSRAPSESASASRARSTRSPPRAACRAGWWPRCPSCWASSSTTCAPT
jgi:tight adherence protein B